ncbi:WS/DGAT domain-containing protein [Actinoplanes sp. NPDC024001]|uniref:WS/DGAT domain-containing protein n=1 Tax=Actinoplanes sp. NPDC024001 TaxID=3154598 RepID=UPI0033DE09E8
MAVLHLDLASAKAAAHRHRATVNDLVLALAAGGVRALLTARGEPLEGLRLHSSVAVSLRTAGATAEAGNRTGGFLVELPVAEPDPAQRLRRVAAATTHAKQEQPVTGGNDVLTALARLRVMRWFIRHQRLVSVVESDMVGPATPIRLLGAPVSDVFAVGNLAGNVPLSFLALSYAGRLTITVHADADALPDLAVLLAGIRADWAALGSAAAMPGPGRGGRSR